MIKDLFTDLFSQKFVDLVKATVVERLWLLALSMKDKNRLSDCGSVLSKNAVGQDFVWGFRFFVLLVECFRNWAVYTDDNDLVQKYARMKEVVPVHDNDLYYPQALAERPLDHSKVDLLLGSKPQPGAPDRRSQPQSQPADEPPRELLELRRMKEEYLASLFTKTPDVALIGEKHVMLQSLFEAVRPKVAAARLGADGKADLRFLDKLLGVHHTESIETPKGLAKLRQDVCSALTEAYGEHPPEYAQFLGPNSRSNSPNKSLRKEENVFTSRIETELRSAPDLNRVSKPPVLAFHDPPAHRSLSPHRSFEFDLNEHGSANEEEDVEAVRRENERLKSQRVALSREVEQLKEKEKSLSQSVLMRSSYLNGPKVDVSPEILIDEIQRKNREYEALQAKYQGLMGQMNDRMRTQLDRSINGISRIDPVNASSLSLNPRTFDLGTQSRFVAKGSESRLGRF